MKNHTDYRKAMSKREKLWQQTQTLDEVGTLCLLSGLLLGPNVSILSKNKTPKVQYFDKILLSIGAIAVFAAMIKRAVIAKNIKD